MATAHAPQLSPTAPFTGEEIASLNGVLAASTAEQRYWLSGFLAGWSAATVGGERAPLAPLAPTAPAAQAQEPLLILYATESGNAEALAGKARDLARRQGFKPIVRDMADLTVADAARAKNLLVIASTWGEGEPPARAASFYNGLLSADAPRFDGVRFAVLALGDSSYVNFCETGRRLDERLAELGGARSAARVECDLEFDEPAGQWTREALTALRPVHVPAGAEIIRLRPEPIAAPAAADVAWSRVRPFAAEILERVVLTSARSSRETAHVELSLAGSGLIYEPGDSLAVVPENNPALVADLLAAVGLIADDPLSAALTRELDVTTLSRPMMERWQALRPHPKIAELLAGDGWRAFIQDRQLIDLLESFPARLSADELRSLLRRLPERSYSLASSPLAHPDEAHLLVGAVRWDRHGRRRGGVASTWLMDRAVIGEQARVFVKPNRHFRLPQDGELPIIMVGPGTGVAPFRAFLEHRRETGAIGRNWLIFGERNYTYDFYYQLELQELERAGFLHRLDVAFSRDQPEKVYVQHRLWAARDELWAWLQEGARLYVCGDAAAMSKDVDATLRAIARERGGLDEPAAAQWLDGLVRTGQLQRDVY